MTQGTLWGVSVGPGDPELLTLKAVRLIREANVLAIPDTGKTRQLTLEIAQAHINKQEILLCPTPMTHNKAEATAAHTQTADTICSRLDDGKNVAYLCLGDVSIYSSYSYIHELVRARGYTARMVAGVPSFCAAAATANTPLCQGDEQLLVCTPATSTSPETAPPHRTQVIMKTGHHLDTLRKELHNQNKLGHVRLVVNCGMDDERVYEHLEDAGSDVSYFSLAIVKGT